ncbi:MAG: CHAT domain-containing protein, partial [Actinoallomurus sp.]
PYRSGRGVLSDGPTPGFPNLTETEDLGRVTGSLRGRYLVSLAECLLLRHDFAGEDADLREARAAAHEALDVTPEDDPYRASYQLVLARALALGYAVDGRPDDLDDAVSQAELGSSADGGARLGHLLREQFLATGDPRSLHRAVRALEAAGTGGAEKTSVLATVLATLYERTGDSTLLERAVALHREAVAETHERDPARPVRLCGLADALILWAERRSDVSAFHEAVGHRRAALPAHPDQVAALSGLARALHRLSLASADATAEADEARLLALSVALRFPDGHPGRAAVLAPLAPVLATRIGSQHDAGDADLERAITVTREATAALPVTDPERPRRVMELGVALAERLARTGQSADRAGAVVAFTDAARSPGLPAMTRCLAAREWARLTAEAGDWAQAASAYHLAVTLLPQVAVRELRRDDQEFHLTSFARLASDAAAALLRAGGTPDDALSLLERGRGVLLTQAIESTDERGPAPDTGPVPRAGTDGAVAPNGADGPAPPGGTDGPVVVVNASVHGCQALIVTAAGTRAVPLPGLTHQDVVDRSEAFTLAVEIAQDPRHRPDHQLRAARFVGRTLGWLWDAVAEPVLDALPPSYDGTAPLRRIWWMPTGALSFLPLHAAGHHDGGGRTVMDRAISSYTPTLRMLHRSRAALGSAGVGLPRMPLVVSMPTTPGAPELPGVARETGELMRLRPGAVFLETEDATREATVAALATSSWVHFACHAVSDPAEPSASHLVLEDGPLTVMDIARLRIENAGLAYLSACSTARGGARLADEAIHIGSAFQLAGYPHVVATLWPIADTAAATVAAEVYAGMGEGAAAAVHAATRSLRDACGGRSPLLWASHIHIGA